jgi:hypothetical protein
MRIELQWAFTEDDMVKQPCVLCEHAFESKAVIIRSDPHGYEVCEECLRALSGRKATLPGAPWPTWEEYEALVAAHPKPMFEGPDDSSPPVGAHGASWLWTPPEEDVHVTPTILYRLGHGKLEGVTIQGDEEHAMVVFRSEEEAEKFRGATDQYPESEGFKVASMDHEELAAFLKVHGCTYVAMPEPWGEGVVDFFEADTFIGMLEESVTA